MAMIGPERVDSVTLPEVDIVASIKMPGSDEKGAYSATTIGRAALENRHINSVKELTSTVPNFYQPDYGSRMTSSVYVRGFGSRSWGIRLSGRSIGPATNCGKKDTKRA